MGHEPRGTPREAVPDIGEEDITEERLTKSEFEEVQRRKSAVARPALPRSHPGPGGSGTRESAADDLGAGSSHICSSRPSGS